MAHKKMMTEMTFFGSVHYGNKKNGEHNKNVGNTGFQQKDLQLTVKSPNSETPNNKLP